MANFLGSLGASYSAGQEGRMNDAKIQSQQLANAINQLSLKKQQLDSQAANLAGNYAASPASGANQPPAPMGGPGLPTPQTGGIPTNLPMPAATPMNASQLQPPGGGGAPGPMPSGPAPVPMRGAAPPMGGAPAAAPAPTPPPAQQQQVPWWRAAAADMKKANPNASGEEIMAAIEKLSPAMTAQNKQDFENFKLHVEQQQKDAQLTERERNDTMMDSVRRQNADTNAARAASYDKSINERNQRALDNIGIKLQAAKAKGPDASKDPAYRALETQYKQVSQDLRASQALGAQTTPEQTLMLQDKLTALSSKMDMYVNAKSGGGATDGSPSVPLAGSDAAPADAAHKEGDILEDGKGNRVQLINNQWVPAPGE